MNEIMTNPLLTGLFGVIGPTIIIYFWNLFLSRDKVYDFGYRIMSILMTFSFEKIGEKHGRKFLDKLCNTITDLTEGMRDATLGRRRDKKNEKG